MWATFGVSVGACLTSLSRARHRESLSPPHRPNCCGGGRCSVSTAALKREGRILADFVPWHQPRRFCSSDGRAKDGRLKARRDAERRRRRRHKTKFGFILVLFW